MNPLNKKVVAEGGAAAGVNEVVNEEVVNEEVVNEEENPFSLPLTPLRASRERNPFRRNMFGDYSVKINPLTDFKPSKIVEEASSSSEAKKFDVSVIFSFDTTGSMSPVIDSVRKNLNETVRRLFKDIPNIGIGCISHGDYCDRHVMIKLEPTKHISYIEEFVINAPNTGGGDSAECYEYVLDVASRMNWNSDIKVLVVIGDEVPHEKGYQMPSTLEGFQSELHLDWKQLVEECKKKEITIFSCHAMADRNKHAVDFYHHISKETNGYYFELNELQSFPYFMVTICMKAADSAENLKLLREKQAELEVKMKEESEKIEKIKSIEKKMYKNEILNDEDTNFINLNSSKKIKNTSDRSESYEAVKTAFKNLSSNYNSSSIEFNEIDTIQKETKSKGVFNNLSFSAKSSEIRREKGISTRIQSIEEEFLTKTPMALKSQSVVKMMRTISSDSPNIDINFGINVKKSKKEDEIEN